MPVRAKLMDKVFFLPSASIVIRLKGMAERETKMYRLTHYCRTHNVRICLYIAYIACGSASLYTNTLYFFLTVLALSQRLMSLT